MSESEPAIVLIVDDEKELRDMMSEYLSQHGFRVLTAANGAQARKLMTEQPAQLVLLDLRMPGEDGLSLARHLHEHYGVAMIMVTAADGVVDRVAGLEVGADDYLCKPFHLRELLARVRSVLRRASPLAEEGAARVKFGRCVLDLGSRRLFALDGAEVPITAMEFDLLQAFARNPNRPLSRDQILSLTQSREWDPYDRSVDIRIARLRHKIEIDPTKPQAIKTLHGVGYMFAPHSPKT